MFQRSQNYLLILMLAITLVYVAANVTIYEGVTQVDGKEAKYEVNFYMCLFNGSKVMNTYLFIATNFLALIIVSTIRTFKNLSQQLLGCKVIFVLLVVNTYLMYFPQGKINEMTLGHNQQSIQPLTWAYLSLFVLNLLVYRGIAKDKKLLESVDRLR